MPNCCFNHAAEVADKFTDIKDFDFKISLASGMYVCRECGNKRCPKATDCSLGCTKSNAPRQVGSRY
jgi:hypothetical protein